MDENEDIQHTVLTVTAKDHDECKYRTYKICMYTRTHTHSRMCVFTNAFDIFGHVCNTNCLQLFSQPHVFAMKSPAATLAALLRLKI